MLIRDDIKFLIYVNSLSYCSDKYADNDVTEKIRDWLGGW